MVTSAAWRRLSTTISECQRCPLGLTRQHAVIYRGGTQPSVVLVGEAPGAAEDREGLPFVGRSGRRLDAALAAVGLLPEDFGIVNLIKCRPPENRFDLHAAATCRPYLDEQLELLAPRMLVSLGARALQALDPQAPPITECAGRLRPTGRIPLFPMLHPAAPLHNPRLRERWDADVVRLGAAVADLREKVS